MTRTTCTPIIITEGRWMHIPHTRIYHRHYPEIRGEGRSLTDAANHLARQLTLVAERAHGRGGDVIERALADLKAVRPARQPRPHQASTLLSVS